MRYKDNPNYWKKYYRDYKKKKRIELINLLGGKCSKCGFSDMRALQIDHVNGGGHKDKNQTGTAYYSYVIKQIKAGSKEYQLLCANCNWIKREERKEWGQKLTCPLLL